MSTSEMQLMSDISGSWCMTWQVHGMGASMGRPRHLALHCHQHLRLLHSLKCNLNPAAFYL